MGGSNSDGGSGVAVDAAGNAYVVGTTGSLDFPTTDDAFQPEAPMRIGAGSAFVSKIDVDAGVLVYSTYLGGSGGSRGSGDNGGRVAVDVDGNAHVVGFTASADFPRRAAFQERYGGGRFDGFLTKLSADGSCLVYSTFLGGEREDKAVGVAVDGDGNAYVAGATNSTSFPTRNAIQPTFGGGRNCRPFSACDDAFVAKFAPDGLAAFSTYLGGDAHDEAGDIALDAFGNAYVVGMTASRNFPITANALQPELALPKCDVTRDWLCRDAFVTVLDPTGSKFIYSTYLGGTSEDGGSSIAVDSAADVYITGWTSSSNFPTHAALQPSRGGSVDAFVAKLDLRRSELVYSTYLGGSNIDVATGIGVDSLGNAYITGVTLSTDFPMVDPLTPFRPTCVNIFVSKVNASGSALEFSTHLGPPPHDPPTCDPSDEYPGAQVAVDSSGNAYVTGYTDSSEFPTVNPLQPPRRFH